jgi:hypothetical protein
MNNYFDTLSLSYNFFTMLMLYMRYSASSCLNPCKFFLYLHTWVSFWYKLLCHLLYWKEHSFTCKFQSIDTTRGISSLLEQVVAIVFSLHLEEPLNIAMVPFISVFQIFLNTLFFIITFISSSRLLLVGSNKDGSLCDSQYNNWLLWIFFISWNLHVTLHVSLYLSCPWSIL